MNPSPVQAATLLMHCPDQLGIVAAVTGFISENNGNVIDINEYVDSDEKVFFMRLQWELQTFKIPAAEIEKAMTPLFERFSMTRSLHFSNQVPRMAILCSKQSHCLYDILARYHSGEWDVEIPLILSNHSELEHVAHQFDVNFYCLPISAENKAAQEEKELALLAEHDIDFVVLARYMQIISPKFIAQFPNRVINIHHSFLPAFAGAKPYHAAHERGVKIIGATSHYVTADLDAGPIIAQDVAHVHHKHAVKDLTRKGKDLEKVVLARAIWLHLQRRILVYKNKTIIFD